MYPLGLDRNRFVDDANDHGININININTNVEAGTTGNVGQGPFIEQQQQ